MTFVEFHLERTDGFGGQYQGILSIMAYCKNKQLNYIHTPFKKIANNVNAGKANDFIGITNNSFFPSENDKKIIIKNFSSEVHFHMYPSVYYNTEFLEIIRKFYYSSKKPEINEIDIAIHIRRGDVSCENNKNRYTDNTNYKEIINKLKTKYPSYTIKIFSEGKHEDFKDLEIEEKNIILNQDIFETFHSLVSAKILVTAKSSFSYCAGMINTNSIYYIDFWHKKLDHWLEIKSLISN